MESLTMAQVTTRASEQILPRSSVLRGLGRVAHAMRPNANQD